MGGQIQPIIGAATFQVTASEGFVVYTVGETEQLVQTQYSPIINILPGHTRAGQY